MLLTGFGLFCCSSIALALASVISEDKAKSKEHDVWLSSLEIDNVIQDLSKTGADCNLYGKSLSINGTKFDKGISTHAWSLACIETRGAKHFSARVGIDDSAENHGSVVFEVWTDEKLLWQSPLVKGGMDPVPVDLDLSGLAEIYLVATDGGDGIGYDYADWVDAKFSVSGENPRIVPVEDEPVILTPKPSPKPRINSPAVFGVRPDSPFLYTIAATGERPMAFSAINLPEELYLDEKTGQITGKLSDKAEYQVILQAKNALGIAEKPLKICVGDQIALTPPMGWNDWNCWGSKIDQEKVLNAAKTIKKTGLADHGWSYVNIDDAWQGERGGEFSALQGNEKFPDIKGLADTIHAMGLKIGIYSTPWVTSYANYPGGSEDPIYITPKPFYDRYHGRHSFALNDARQWGAWGIDYLKYDWFPNDEPHVGEMEEALRASGRDIVYSLSNHAPFEIAPYLEKHSNCWRTTVDIRDRWGSVREIGLEQERWLPYAGRGHWIDPDMLVVGYVGWNKDADYTQLTPSEQYSHISLWCLVCSPLLIGCDLDKLDDFTLNLLTNDEVLAVDQDPLGIPAKPVLKEGTSHVWSKPMEDGSLAVGLFNEGQFKSKVSISWEKLGISGPQKVRDLWRQKDLGIYTGKFEADVTRHGVVLVNVTPAETE